MSDHFTSSPEPQKNPTPTPPPMPPTGGAVVVGSSGDVAAERYIASQLQHERQTLRVSQIVSVLVLLFVGGYLYAITSKFKSSLEPDNAAQIASGMMMQQIDDNGPQFVQQVREQVPQYIEKTPDYVLAELPKYRMQIADRVEQDLNKYCTDTSKQLSDKVDSLLDEHKDHVQAMLKDGNDPATVKQMGEDMKQKFHEYINSQQANGQSVGEEIDKALEALTDVQKRVHRLATATDLTPQEKKARHAIAVLTQGIDVHKSELQLTK